MNFIAKSLIAQTPAEQVADILHLLRPLLRQAEDFTSEPTIESVTPAMARILDCLHSEGAQTAPALARALGTGRQFIQRMANDLLSCELIERSVNPAHRKSWLLTLTEKGHAHVAQISRHEHEALKELAKGVAGEDLQTCLNVLDHFMAELSGREQPRPVKKLASKPARKPAKQQVAQSVTDPEVGPEVRPEVSPEIVEAKLAGSEQVEPERPNPAGGLNWNGGGGLRLA